jgi:hypothetical protein
LTGGELAAGGVATENRLPTISGEPIADTDMTHMLPLRMVGVLLRHATENNNLKNYSYPVISGQEHPLGLSIMGDG